MRTGVLEVGLSLKRQQEGNNSVQDGLEEVSWNTSFDEVPELSQQEELHNLELHPSKAVCPSVHSKRGKSGGGGEINL